MPAQADAEPFLPLDFSPPTRLDHPAFRLQPLGPEHNERDHAAGMGSIDHIRATPGCPDGGRGPCRSSRTSPTSPDTGRRPCGRPLPPPSRTKATPPDTGDLRLRRRQIAASSTSRQGRGVTALRQQVIHQDRLGSVHGLCSWLALVSRAVRPA